MNSRDTMALLGYAEMLDDTVDLRNDSHNMSGGEPVRILMNEVQRLEREIVRLKIAHLRRMAERANAMTGWIFSKRHFAKTDRIRRFRSACLAKITELKESQCSTKS